MKPQTVLNAVKLIKTGEVIELGHVLNANMPFFGTRRFDVHLKRTFMNEFANRRGSNEELVISRSLALAGLFYFVTPLMHSYYLLIATSFALGLALGCCNPLAMMLAYTRSPPGNSGQALGVRQSFNKTTQVLMPLVFGSVGTTLGLSAVFWSTGALLAAASYFIRVKAKTRSGDRT